MMIRFGLAMAVLSMKIAISQPISSSHPKIRERVSLPGAAHEVTGGQILGDSVTVVWSAFGLWRTSEGGRTWTQLVSPGKAQGLLTSCHFLTSSFGWILTGDGVHFTSDGGTSWTGRTSKQFYPRDVSCAGNKFPCWVGGSEDLPPNPFAKTKPAIFRTIDGGSQWEGVDLPASEAREIRSIHFSSAEDGMAVGDHAMFYTRDGGATWATGRLKDECVSPGLRKGRAYDSYGVAYFGDSAWVALDHALLRTDDGGRSFCEVGYPPDATFRQLIFTARTTGWAVDRWGQLYRTTDAGFSWHRRKMDLRIVFLDVLSPNFALIVSDGEVYRVELQE